MKLFLIILSFCTFTQAATITLNVDNFVALRNEISDTSISKLQLELAKKVEARGFKNYTIYLVIDSGGGAIDSGLTFIEYAKTIPNLETVTLFAASMASAIVEALPGKRHILNSGILMFHRARGGFDGQFEDGELESRLTLYKKVVRNMEQVNADRLKITLDVYKAKVKDEYWLLGSDTIKQNAADSVVSLVCTNSVITAANYEAFNFMGSTIDVKFSACPLIKQGEVLAPSNKSKYEEYKLKSDNMRMKK